jgi:AraC-like DNA-binding protein
MTQRPPSPHIREAFCSEQIRRSPRFSYIALDNELLGLPPLDAGAPAPASERIRYEGAKDDFIGSLRQALLSYIPESHVSVDFAAELSSTSKRTLQRRLAAGGTSFSRLLDDSRLELALRMLRDSEMPVAEVSYLLGYSDPSHFSRAFRRMAGVSPRAYRRASMQ